MIPQGSTTELTAGVRFDNVDWMPDQGSCCCCIALTNRDA